MSENIIRESEAKFRKIFKYAPFGASINGLKGNILMANRALCRMMGYSKEELERMHFSQITHPDDQDTNEVLFKKLISNTKSGVLIQGESGTGKELVAREIHSHSSRSEAVFIRVNCAAIPKELYESEFFGHVKGAFTGVVKERIGRFEAADGGTIVLDEVGEIPLSLQSKLLRILQEGEYERLGDEKTRRVDVRVIAATNKNLTDEVTHKRFQAV